MKSLYRSYLFIALLLLSCTNASKNTYAIKDFRVALQPHLKNIVSIGVVGYDRSTKYIEKQATDEELIKLSKSEHPVLRAVAFREMLERNTFNHYDVIMNNLDDTATIATDAGEWGIRYYKISDDIVQHGKWKDSLAKDRTIHTLITKHNYLHTAYRALLNVDPKEEYYAHIKRMAMREPDPDEDLFALEFYETEYALYALAKFKKAEDITIIKNLLLVNCWRMGDFSFRLMKEYPNEAYMQVYEKYYPKIYYRIICQDQTVTNAVDYIESLATYKNNRSARILDSILNKKPFIPCPADTGYCKFSLIYAIWNNPCYAYIKLRSQVRKEIQDHEKNAIVLPPDTTVSPPDSSSEPVHWW